MHESILPACSVTLVALLCGSAFHAPQSPAGVASTPASTVSAEETPLAAQERRESYISLGDEVTVSDSFHPEELAVTAVVQQDGTLLMPELGKLMVTGLTPEELQHFLMERYSAYYDLLDIQVEVKPLTQSYFLFGEFMNEGRREFRGELNLWEAVTLNNPDLRSANLGRVRLIRPGPVNPQMITVDIAQMIETGDSTYNVHVQDLDLVFVPPLGSEGPDASHATVPEHLAQAAAGMESFAATADPTKARRARELMETLQRVSEEFAELSR